MSITFKNGNLFDSDAQAIVNAVNCVGVMGKGIALEFRKRYPAMFRRYADLCRRGAVRLGEPYIDQDGGRVIINFPTKGHYRNPSRMDDIRSGLRNLRALLEESGVTSVALPALGCGNGGLNWRDVRPVVIRELGCLTMDVQVYEPR